jgi:hypothetical protein
VLVCHYLLHPDCIEQGNRTSGLFRKDSRGPLSTKNTALWHFPPGIKGGVSIKGAGKNAEFLHIGPNNELWSEIPPGRHVTVLSLTNIDKSSLMEVLQLTPLKAGGSDSSNSQVYQIHEFTRPKVDASYLPKQLLGRDHQVKPNHCSRISLMLQHH